MSKDVTIDPVVGQPDLDDFLDLPSAIYRGDPNWVPPIRKEIAAQLADTSPFRNYGDFQSFLARTNGAVVGRIVAAINRRLIEKEGNPVGLFGYFECIDDVEVATGLLNQACRWTSQRGSTSIRGPINLSTHLGGLVLVEGFDSPPYIMMPYTPRYYGPLLEATGLRPAKDAYAYDFPMVLDHRNIFERSHRLAVSAGIEFRPVRLRGRSFEDDCRAIYRVFTEAFADNWSATPRSEDEFLAEARDLRLIADPDVFPVAEHNGRMVGFCLCLPDINMALKHVGGRLNATGLLKLLWYRRKIDRARVLALAVLPEYRRSRLGIAAAMVYLSFRGGLNKKRPYRRAEFSWVWEDNRVSRNLIEAMGVDRYKTYRVYEKPLTI